MNENTNTLPDMSTTTIDVEWLVSRYEKCSERYISAESKLLQIATMPFYKRIFLSKKIAYSHLNKVLDKYDF